MSRLLHIFAPLDNRLLLFVWHDLENNARER